MSNFNAVFFAVKKVCYAEANYSSHIENIINETKMQPGKIEYYIQCLEEIGLVKYSKDTQALSLTDSGKVKERVFPEQQTAA